MLIFIIILGIGDFKLIPYVLFQWNLNLDGFVDSIKSMNISMEISR